MIKYIAPLVIILSCSNNPKPLGKESLSKIDSLLTASWVNEFVFQNHMDSIYKFDSSNIGNNLNGLQVKLTDSIIRLNFILAERAYKVELKCEKYLLSDTNFVCIGKNTNAGDVEILKLNFKDSTLFIEALVTKDILQSSSNFFAFRRISSKELTRFDFLNWELLSFFENKKFLLKQKDKTDQEVTAYFANDIFFKSAGPKTSFFIQKVDYLLDNSTSKKIKAVLQFDKIENPNWIPFILVKNKDKSIDFYESDRTYKKMLKKFTFASF